jgi:chromosome segregation ATPase
VVQAAQDQWKSKKSQIDHDTEILIQSSRKAIEESTIEAKETLTKLKKSIQTQQSYFEKQRTAQEHVFSKVEAQIEDLNYNQKVLFRTNASLQEENRVLTSELEINKETIEHLKRTKEELSSAIADLHIQDEQAADHLVELRHQEQELSNKIADLTTAFTTTESEYKDKIEDLKLKKHVLEQEIIQEQTKQEKEREELAVWEKSLQEQDKNIRIREAKIDAQEKSIVRNYNLLNL